MLHLYRHFVWLALCLGLAACATTGTTFADLEMRLNQSQVVANASMNLARTLVSNDTITADQAERVKQVAIMALTNINAARHALDVGRTDDAVNWLAVAGAQLTELANFYTTHTGGLR